MAAPMNNQPPRLLQFFGAGLELAGCVLLAIFAGSYGDRVFVLENPWLKVIGGILGFAVGMYKFVQRVQSSNS